MKSNISLFASCHKWGGFFSLLLLMTIMSAACLKSKDLEFTPHISHISPNAVAKGATLLIRGENFVFSNATTTVKLTMEGPQLYELDGVSLLSYVKNNEIRFPMPELQPGMYSVYLTVLDRQGNRRSNTVHIQVLEVGVSEISPERAVAGTEITIRGTALKNTTKVLFTGLNYQQVEAIPVVPPTNEEIRVVIPQGAIPGPISLSAANFIIQGPEYHVALPAPAILDISGTNLKPGDKISISGANFGPAKPNDWTPYPYSRRVLFQAENGGQVEGILSNAPDENTDTKTTVYVPLGATSGPLELEIDGIKASNSPQLTITPVQINHGMAFYDNNNVYLAAMENGASRFFKLFSSSGFIAQAIHADPQSRKIYFNLDNEVSSITFDGSDLTTVASGSASKFYNYRNKVYYLTSDKRVISTEGEQIAQLPDNDVLNYELDLGTGFAYGVRIDYNTGMNKIFRVNLETGEERAIYQDLAPAMGIEDIRVHNNQIYLNYRNSIVTARIDGTGPIETVVPDLQYAANLTIDLRSNRLVFIDGGVIYSSALDGSDKRIVFNTQSDHPFLSGLYSYSLF
ncbi:IPT/TIG domain-containing protein [Desertivirga xinjiangensis]|uniref:IPT/TIG domain-containing protein n=1 Tax=Desertivirga xinjiangensis TaxID=539206 RepID=UPI0021090C26|nr:IPT/TIG domain-containing protein [Pedobacter xinjiangensis]